MRLQDRDATLADRLSLGGFVIDMRDVGEELVAAHSDLRSQEIVRNVLSVAAQRIEPRMRVCVVAVEQCAIDVEEDCSNARHGSPSECVNSTLQSTCRGPVGTFVAPYLDMNAIDLLKQQHQKTKEALTAISEGKKSSPTELRQAANELVAHMVIEEHVFYPRIKELMEDMIDEAFEEHAVARFELARLMQASSSDERKTHASVLKELIEHHVKEEENEVFPKVKRSIQGDELERLGAKMLQMFGKAVGLGLEKLVVSPNQSLRGGARRPARARMAKAGTRKPKAQARGGRRTSRASAR